jgi:hypothetical protein
MIYARTEQSERKFSTPITLSERDIKRLKMDSRERTTESKRGSDSVVAT